MTYRAAFRGVYIMYDRVQKTCVPWHGLNLELGTVSGGEERWVRETNTSNSFYSPATPRVKRTLPCPSVNPPRECRPNHIAQKPVTTTLSGGKEVNCYCCQAGEHVSGRRRRLCRETFRVLLEAGCWSGSPWGARPGGRGWCCSSTRAAPWVISTFRVKVIIYKVSAEVSNFLT